MANVSRIHSRYANAIQLALAAPLAGLRSSDPIPHVKFSLQKIA